jgi:hypothetical protein
MSDSRKKPGAAFWTVVVLFAVLVVYPLTFGPACWVCSRVPESIPPWEAADFFYAPILRAWWHADPGTVSNVLAWYANLGAEGGLTVARGLDGSFCLIYSGWR